MMTMKTAFKILALTTAASVAFAACAPVQILNGITPSSSFAKAEDISYGPLARQKLDIYKAETAKAGAPAIVFIHGGSWTEGSKDIYKFLAEGFTKDGYDVVVPNYRLYPETKYPGMIEDSAEAVAFAARQYPDRPLVVMGHSAGAYNMLMVMLDPKYAKAAGLDLCSHVAGAISLSGPTGIIPLDSEPYITIFPDRFTAGDAPLNNVKSPSPPILFGHGLDDTTVYPQNSQALADKMNARGGKAIVKTYEGMNHTEAVQFLSRRFDGKATLKQDIVNFIDSLPKSGSFCQ
jgi:acetyl esterase/lipase